MATTHSPSKLPKTGSTRRKISLPWFRQASIGEKLTRLRLPRQNTVDCHASSHAPSGPSSAPCTAPCPCNVVRDWKPLFWVETSLTELKFVRSLVRVLKLELERPLLLLLLKLDTSLLLTLLLL